MSHAPCKAMRDETMADETTEDETTGTRRWGDPTGRRGPLNGPGLREVEGFLARAAFTRGLRATDPA